MEDDTGEDDVGVIEAFNTWWQVELDEEDDSLEGRRVLQRVDDVEQVDKHDRAAGEGATDEDVVGE